MFDATIPDHFALAVGLELLRARYEKCGAYFPSQARDELRRVSAAMPALQDVLTAPWLLDYFVGLADLVAIEQMREDAFGEKDPLRGLGECVVIHVAKTRHMRAGIDDRVARRMARARGVSQFTALQVIQALWRYCGITKGEAWDLYQRLLTGTGRRGTQLTSLEVLGRTKFEKYLGSPEISHA